MYQIAAFNRSRALAQELRQAIRRGRWAIGQPLPPTRQIAREQGMSLATVQVGLRELESAGLVERQPRRGVVVKSRLGRGWAWDEAVQQIGIVAREPPRGDAGDDWSYRVSRSIVTAVGDGQMHPILLAPGDAANAHEELLRRIESCGQALCGIIAFNGEVTSRLLPALDKLEMPWVVINRYTSSAIHNFVAADNLLGCQLVGECFARMGLRRVMVLMSRGINSSEAEKEKITGLLYGFMGVGAPINGIDYLVCGEDVPSRGVVQNYLESHEPPEAIFSLNDIMASGAIAACMDAGLSVPDQVKIVGGAGLDLGLHTRPTLSVIAQPMAELGRQAYEMLLEMIKSGRNRIDRRRIKGKLILRESFPLPPEVRAALEQSYPGMIE